MHEYHGQWSMVNAIKPASLMCSRNSITFKLKLHNSRQPNAKPGIMYVIDVTLAELMDIVFSAMILNKYHHGA